MKTNQCPICREENSCMVGTAEQGNCWCVHEKFPKGIFELVPAESIDQQCICQKCVNNKQEDNT